MQLRLTLFNIFFHHMINGEILILWCTIIRQNQPLQIRLSHSHLKYCNVRQLTRARFKHSDISNLCCHFYQLPMVNLFGHIVGGWHEIVAINKWSAWQQQNLFGKFTIIRVSAQIRSTKWSRDNILQMAWLTYWFVSCLLAGVYI